MTAAPSYVPLYARLTGRKVVVFGGGSVAARRARFFARAGARVVVAALDFSPETRRLAEEGLVELVEADATSREAVGRLVEDAFLVVVATSSPEANRVVVEEARRAGALVNDATDAKRGDVVVPFHAEVYNGGLHVAVTSLGAAGVAAHRALEKIVECLEGSVELKTLYRVFREFKEWLKNTVPSPRERLSIYFTVAGDKEFNTRVARGEVGEALARAKAIALQALGKPAEDEAKPGLQDTRVAASGEHV